MPIGQGRTRRRGRSTNGLGEMLPHSFLGAELSVAAMTTKGLAGAVPGQDGLHLLDGDIAESKGAECSRIGKRPVQRCRKLFDHRNVGGAHLDPAMMGDEMLGDESRESSLVLARFVEA